MVVYSKVPPLRLTTIWGNLLKQRVNWCTTAMSALKKQYLVHMKVRNLCLISHKDQDLDSKEQKVASYTIIQPDDT